MSTKFIGVTSSAVVASSVEVAVPSVADLLPGDLLFVFVAVQGFSATTLTMPDATWILEQSPVSVVDQIVFTALHYVGVAAEPSTYTFTYGTSKSMVAFMAAYRGTKQDILFDPTNYPLGYYAPAGSFSGSNALSSVSSISSPIVLASSLVPFGRSLFFFCGTHASATPLLSDVAPLAAIRAKVQQAKISAVLCDVLEPVVVPLLPTYTVLSNLTLSGAIGLSRTFEPIVAANDTFDTYKAKIMRRLLPPPYRGRYADIIPRLVTVFGGGDNDIGGLFNEADFLPDEVP